MSRAVDRIRILESRIRYKKVGRKYVPADDTWGVICDQYDVKRITDTIYKRSSGWYLAHYYENGSSTRALVEPARAELIAAARSCEDDIMNIIRTASLARPKESKLSEEAHKDWQAFITKHGDEFNTLWYPSIQENAENIMKAIINYEK